MMWASEATRVGFACPGPCVGVLDDTCFETNGQPVMDKRMPYSPVYKSHPNIKRTQTFAEIIWYEYQVTLKS